MTGKERILNTFNHKPVDTVPWVPFAGVHAGKLIGETARTVFTDAEVLKRSLEEAHRIYRPDGLPIMFDLQIEAEILGCDLLWSEDAPPTVTSHPLEESEEIPTQLPAAGDGRLGMALDAMRHMKEKVGSETALYGLFCGPFTLASHLRGTEIFMDMFDDPDYVHRLLAYTTDVAAAMVGHYVEAGADVLAAVDPLVSQISPDHFQEFLAEPFRRIFAVIREADRASSFFVCGDATRNISVMCDTRPDGISIDENINMAEAKKVTDAKGVVIAGNIPLASVMLFGNQQDNMKVVIDELDAVDHANLIVSPGCDMPYDVPIENTIACEQAVHQTEQSRELVANYTQELPDIEVAIPDYTALERPMIEVFTIDSDTCAACTYMFRSAMDAKRTYGDGLDVVEYKATKLENIVRGKRMGIKQLPSIYINGKLAFESIIPGPKALNEAIEAARTRAT
jgi:uroporphyrinogen decarboxylase